MFFQTLRFRRKNRRPGHESDNRQHIRAHNHRIAQENPAVGLISRASCARALGATGLAGIDVTALPPTLGEGHVREGSLYPPVLRYPPRPQSDSKPAPLPEYRPPREPLYRLRRRKRAG